VKRISIPRIAPPVRRQSAGVFVRRGDQAWNAPPRNSDEHWSSKNGKGTASAVQLRVNKHEGFSP